MRRLLLLGLLLSGCSSGPQADLPSIAKARSLAAEWALVNEEAARNHLTRTFTTTIRKDLRAQLDASAKSLTVPSSVYGQQIRMLAAEPDNASPQQLRAGADRLKAIEDHLESA